MSANDSPATPASVWLNNKRGLQSPEDLAEAKKNKVHEPGSFTSAVTVDSSPTTTTISLDPEGYQHIVAALKESFITDMKAIIQSTMQDAIHSVVDGVVAGLRGKIVSLESENSQLKKSNETLNNRVTKLERAADEAEQYSRRNCLRIIGIPEPEPDEDDDDDNSTTVTDDTDQHVLDLCQTLNVKLDIKDIDRSHRVGRNGKSRPIIVKFTSYRARRAVYNARRGLREKVKDVFINEDLTKHRSTLLYHARTLAKEEKIKGAWSADGNILVKDMSSKIHRLSCLSDLTTY